MTRSLFAPRRGAPIVLSLALAFGLAACAEGESDASAGGNGNDASAAASAGASTGADGGGTATVENGTVEVTADNLAFSVETITAPAGEAFTVTFTNNESVPHNFSVYTEEGGDEIAIGNVIGEGETDEIAIDALEPGEYFFVCDVHAQEMTGTLVVEG
jgi:plastocyanin